MGISASGNVEITCKDENKAIDLENLFAEDINQTLSDYHKKINNTSCYFDFHSGQRDGDTIYLENESGRVQNCEWQLDMLLQFIKEKGKDLVILFSADVSTSENYIYDEFDEEGNLENEN